MDREYAELTEDELYRMSPQELTAVLYEALLRKLQEAVLAIEEKQFMRANRLLQRGNDILRRLGAGLNYEAGIIADQLEAIYNYMAERLIEANVKKDAALINEVRTRADELKQAWDQALTHQEQSRPVMQNAVRAYENNL
jgi:flagellar protein FliS